MKGLFQRIMFIIAFGWLFIAFVQYPLKGAYKKISGKQFHTYLAKLSAVIQALFIITSLFFSPFYPLFYLMILVGILETLEEITLIFIYDNWVSDVKSIFWSLKDKRRIMDKNTLTKD